MPDEISQNIAGLSDLNHDNYGKIPHNYLLNTHVFTRNNITIQNINLSCLTINFAGTKGNRECDQYNFITVKFAKPIGE